MTYFVNPEWPGTFDGSVECPITVQKVDSNICQYRLDFEEFTLAQPEPIDHICESDVFVVAGGRPVPPICGENAGQHSKFPISILDNCILNFSNLFQCTSMLAQVLETLKLTLSPAENLLQEDGV